MRVLDIVPTWQEHQSGSACWCRPTYARNLATDNLIWTHRAASDDPAKYVPEADPALRDPSRAWAVLEYGRPV